MSPNRNDQSSGDPSSEDALSALQAAIELARQLQHKGVLDADDTLVLRRGLAAAMTAGATAWGECVDEVPYAQIWPVSNGGHLEWWCNHKPEHKVRANELGF